MEGHYKKLSKLAILVKTLYPGQTTVHGPIESIDKESIYPEDLRVLYEMLVHTITLINKLYRRQDREGSYISQREDYATALMLISPLFSIQTIKLPESVRNYYQQITNEIGYSSSFTWKDLQKITGKSKTRCNNIIGHLTKLELIKKTGKGYRDIYQYEIVPLREQMQPTSIWDEAVSEWEGFKAWVEF